MKSKAGISYIRFETHVCDFPIYSNVCCRVKITECRTYESPGQPVINATSLIGHRKQFSKKEIYHCYLQVRKASACVKQVKPIIYIFKTD